MMIHNFIKYLVQTRLRLLEICYFYISQMKSSLDKIFYKIVYHYIIYMCDFLVNLYNFFAVVCTDFHGDCSCTRYVPNYVTHFSLFYFSFCCIWREENIVFGLWSDVHCFPIKHSGQECAVSFGVRCRLVCSVLVNSDSLTVNYGVKQNQFTKPISEPPR